MILIGATSARAPGVAYQILVSVGDSDFFPEPSYLQCKLLDFTVTKRPEEALGQWYHERHENQRRNLLLRAYPYRLTKLTKHGCLTGNSNANNESSYSSMPITSWFSSACSPPLAFCTRDSSARKANGCNNQAFAHGAALPLRSSTRPYACSY